jgi:replicative DNA helicase
MQAQLSELAAAGLDPETDDEAFFAAVDGASFAAGEVVERKRIKQVLRSVIAELGERMRLRKEGGTGLVGIPTGFEQLDAWTGGLRAGKLYVVGARPKMGKSAFAGNVVEQSALLGIPWLVFSAEMLANELGERMIASRGGIDTTALNNGLLSQRDWVMLTKAASDLAETQVQFVDRRGLRIGQVIAEARRWRAELDAKAKGERPRCGIVVDYLQLFLPDKEDRNREREVAAISRGLKELAGICECPVVALAQLNRELEKRDDKRPRPADLRDSGSVEQDADLLAFLYRDEVYDPRPENPHRGVAELIISLARGIPTGTLYFTWQGEHTRFRQLDNPPPPKGKASRNGHAHGEPMPHWMDDR